MRRMSVLFRKTFLIALLLFGTVSALTSLLSGYMLYKSMAEEFESKGRAIAVSIAESSREVLLNRDAAMVQSKVDQYLGIRGVNYVFVTDGAGEILAHTFVPSVPSGLAGRNATRGMELVELTLPGVGEIIDISQPVLAGFAGRVHVGMDKSMLQSFFWDAFIKMQGLLLFVFAVFTTVLYVLVGRISLPLEALTAKAERLAAHDFTVQFDTRSNDEIGRLSSAMKSMASELSDLFVHLEHQVEQATGEVRVAALRNEAIISNMADGLIVVDEKGMPSLLNPAVREMFAIDGREEDAVERSRFFPPEMVELMARTTEGGAAFLETETPLAGGVGMGRAVASPIRSEREGDQRSWVIIVRDVTREWELDRLKTDFISTVSHELRTPMTSVLGFSKIISKRLEQGVFPLAEAHEDRKVQKDVRKVRSNLGIIISEAERLTSLINDVLDIAKMESGKIEWRDTVISMPELVQESVERTKGLWEPRGLDVFVDAGDEPLPPVVGDRDRLLQVMVNLISNAVKFTERGSVICRVRIVDGMVITSVEDTGVGIDPKELGLVFEKFKQVGDTLTEKPRGTGLGLPICKQIITRHAGDVWVESAPGYGSVFSFSLPASNAEVPVRVKALAQEEAICDPLQDLAAREGRAMLVQEDLKKSEQAPLILVVDDDPALASYLEQVFLEKGYRVEVAKDGKTSLEKAAKLLPNLITMDLMMPEMDGYTAIHCLRNNRYTRHIPIVVLSALSDTGDAGGDVSLVKPVDDEHITDVVDSLLSERSVRRSCLVLGDAEDVTEDALMVFCPESIRFCTHEEVWEHVNAGFKGTIFIPVEVSRGFDLHRLAAKPGVQVVVMPGNRR